MCQAVIGASNELIGLILIPTTEGRCYYYARFIGEAMETEWSCKSIKVAQPCGWWKQDLPTSRLTPGPNSEAQSKERWNGQT